MDMSNIYCDTAYRAKRTTELQLRLNQQMKQMIIIMMMIQTCPFAPLLNSQIGSWGALLW